MTHHAQHGVAPHRVGSSTIGIWGKGKMAQAIAHVLVGHPTLRLDRYFVREPMGSQDHGLETAWDDLDVVLDFSSADGTLALLDKSSHSPPKALLIGSTGHTPESLERIRILSSRTALLLAPNTSVGVAVLKRMAVLAQKTLGPEYKIGIRDIHHVHKKDAPSGTAKLLADGLKVDHACIQSERVGEVIGEHTVSFNGTLESLKLTHFATDRKLFAEGAIKAAEFLVGKKPGLYSMDDVLSLA